MVDRVATGGVRRSQLLETIEIDFDTMLLLLRACAKFRQRSKALPIRSRRFIDCPAVFGRQPSILRHHSLVRSEAIVVRAVGVGSVGPGHDAAVWRITT